MKRLFITLTVNSSCKKVRYNADQIVSYHDTGAGSYIYLNSDNSGVYVKERIEEIDKMLETDAIIKK